MNNRIYIETPITETEGLEEGWYKCFSSNEWGKIPVLLRYRQFNNSWIDEDGDAFHPSSYLRPAPEGCVVVSEEDIMWEAVEFHEWVGKQGYKLSHYAAKGEAVHIHESKGSTPFYELKDLDYCTTKELYNQFIQTKLTQQGK